MGHYFGIYLCAFIFFMTGWLISGKLFCTYYRFSTCSRYPGSWWDERYPWAPWVTWMAVALLPIAVLMVFITKSSWGFWVHLLGTILWFFTIKAFVIYSLALKYGKAKLLKTEHTGECTNYFSGKVIMVHPEANIDDVVRDVEEGNEYCDYFTERSAYVIKCGPLVVRRWVEKHEVAVYHISPSVKVEPYTGENPFECMVEVE